MSRKTDEELREELKSLQNSFDQAAQVQRNCQERAIAINATLQDRAEAETEKKSIAK